MVRNITRILQDDRGNILVVTLLILFAVTVIGATVAVMSSMDLKISGNQRSQAIALQAAEAGLSETIHRISLPNPTTATINGWTGNIAISDVDPYDPNWKTYVYSKAPQDVPAGSGSVFTTGTLQDVTGDYLKYSEATGTEDVLTIEHKWVDRNGDGIRNFGEVVLYDALSIPPENFDSGFPVEIVTVTGQSGPAKRIVQAEVTRRTLMVRTLGALYVDKAIEVTGSPEFCGFNHDVNTPPFTDMLACVGWHLSQGHLSGVSTTGDNVDVSGNGSDIMGDPTPTDTSSTNPFYSLAEVLGVAQSEMNQILASANNTSIVDPLDGITYINGDAKISSNIVGEGLLYIKGNLETSGSFAFRGLIYVEGDVKMTGGPWVLGSMIVRGTSDYNFASGSAALLYSKDAIMNNVGKAFPAVLLSWREL